MSEPYFDFKDWLADCDLEDYDDVHSLYRSVEENDEYGGFSTTTRNVSDGIQIFVKCDWFDNPLILKSEKQRKFFLDYIESTHCDDMGIEGWYAYHRAMEKDD